MDINIDRCWGTQCYQLQAGFILPRVEVGVVLTSYNVTIVNLILPMQIKQFQL